VVTEILSVRASHSACGGWSVEGQVHLFGLHLLFTANALFLLLRVL
jgi:hypothetical protein